jgi:hypothetical protein
VAPTNIRCELDLDPFDAPMDARVYVDYRNNSDRPVAAVKFRLRFVDAQGRDRGTFHVVDVSPVSPQGGHGVKAKRDFTLHPGVIAIKTRVLQVKYADGSDWSSTKMQELAQPGGAAPPESGVSGGNPEPGPAPAPANVYNKRPTASTSLYGSAQPPPNPREYENPPPTGGTAPGGPSYSAAPPAQNVQAPQSAAPVDSFGGGLVPPSGQAQSVPAQPYANAPAYAPTNSVPNSAAFSPANPTASPARPAGGTAANPTYPGAANPTYPGAAKPSGAAAIPTGPGAANPSSAAANPTDPGAAGNPYPVSRYRGAQPVNVPYSPENDK